MNADGRLVYPKLIGDNAVFYMKVSYCMELLQKCPTSGTCIFFFADCLNSGINYFLTVLR
jgi:hypothetical protein